MVTPGYACSRSLQTSGPARTAAREHAGRLQPDEQRCCADEACDADSHEPKAMRPATTSPRFAATREDAHAFKAVATGVRAPGIPESVKHTWRSSSDKTGHDSSSSSCVSASGAGVSVTEMSDCWSPSATRWAVYHPGALTKREPGATPRGRARQPLLGFLGGLAARAPRPRRRLPSASLSPQQRGTRLPQTGAAEQVLPFVAGRQTPPGGAAGPPPHELAAVRLAAPRGEGGKPQ